MYLSTVMSEIMYARCQLVLVTQREAVIVVWSLHTTQSPLAIPISISLSLSYRQAIIPIPRSILTSTKLLFPSLPRPCPHPQPQSPSPANRSPHTSALRKWLVKGPTAFPMDVATESSKANDGPLEDLGILFVIFFFSVVVMVVVVVWFQCLCWNLWWWC